MDSKAVIGLSIVIVAMTITILLYCCFCRGVGDLDARKKG